MLLKKPVQATAHTQPTLANLMATAGLTKKNRTATSFKKTVKSSIYAEKKIQKTNHFTILESDLKAGFQMKNADDTKHHRHYSF